MKYVYPSIHVYIKSGLFSYDKAFTFPDSSSYIPSSGTYTSESVISPNFTFSRPVSSSTSFFLLAAFASSSIWFNFLYIYPSLYKLYPILLIYVALSSTCAISSCLNFAESPPPIHCIVMLKALSTHSLTVDNVNDGKNINAATIPITAISIRITNTTTSKNDIVAPIPPAVTAVVPEAATVVPAPAPATVAVVPAPATVAVVPEAATVVPAPVPATVVVVPEAAAVVLVVLPTLATFSAPGTPLSFCAAFFTVSLILFLASSLILSLTLSTVCSLTFDFICSF